MINLIRNSLDAVQGKDKAEIIISGNALPDGVGIDVSDNGVGIDEDMLEDVFIPFFTTKTSGSGIGLSLVRQIMRLHGGYVRVYSQKNTGTSFCLVFPFNSDPKFGKR